MGIKNSIILISIVVIACYADVKSIITYEDICKTIKAKQLEVKSLKKNNDTEDEVQAEECKNWQLNASQVFEILVNSKEVTAEEQNIKYYNLPCEILVNLEYKKNLYKYIINASGTSVFYITATNVIYLICTEKCKKIFNLYMGEVED